MLQLTENDETLNGGKSTIPHYRAIWAQGSSLSFLGSTPKGDQLPKRRVPSPCLRTVVLGARHGTRLFKFSMFDCMCTRVVTSNALSARRAYRLRDVSTEIDAHIIGLTGTRLPFSRPLDGSAHKSSVAQHGRNFEVRWEWEQTRFSIMCAGVPILVSKRKWRHFRKCTEERGP